MNLGERYRKLRASVKDESGNPISVKDFAAKCVKLQAPRISELENNKREMSLTELKAYHEYFKVSFEYLMGETDVETVDDKVKAAIEVTGLSEIAIRRIVCMKEMKVAPVENLEYSEPMIETLDRMLTNDTFFKVISGLSVYKCQTRNVVKALLDGSCKNQINQLNTHVKLEFFECDEEFKHLIYSFQHPAYKKAIKIANTFLSRRPDKDKNLITPITQPSEPSKDATESEIEEYNKRYRQYMENKKQYYMDIEEIRSIFEKEAENNGKCDGTP